METTNTTVTLTTTTTAATTTDATVQRVTKKSSDELLRKFAEVGTNEKKELRLIKRRKKNKINENQSESLINGGGTAVVERRSLLPATVSRKSVLLRQLRVRDNRNKSSIFGTIHKTWRRTVKGASRVFMENHYNRHKRLINDIV